MTAAADAPHIGLVVEGLGDLNALPILLRRRLEQRGIFADVLGKPVNCNGRDKATAPKGIEGYVAIAAARPGCRAILVVLDAEKDLACNLGPTLLLRVSKITHLTTAICLAERTFEDWIYASCETLELGELRYRSATVGQSAIKEALKPAKYVKPTWQPRLTHRVDMTVAARRSPSLRRMLHKFDGMVDDHFSDLFGSGSNRPSE